MKIDVKDKKEKTMEMGDVKALREALVHAHQFLHQGRGATTEKWLALVEEINAALAEPPRNCDIGTVKEVYAIYKRAHEAQEDSEWPDIELFESEDDAIMVLSLEVRKHIYDQGFTWNGKELTWTSGNWSYNWWLDKIPVVKKGSIGYNRELGRNN